MPLLLDTCAVLWIAEDAKLARGAVDALQEATDAGEATLVSPISAWEIGLLASRGRIAARAEPLAIFRRVLDTPTMALAGMPPEVLIASSFLPGNPPRDPADRIVAATARTYGLTVMTRDEPLLAYAAAGHLKAIAC
jgi:PIN domain nuclease of toxin-antitoxin system